MRSLLDTNWLTDVLKNQPIAVGAVEACEETWIPFVALAEIKAGYRGGNRLRKNETILNRFLRVPEVGVLYADQETTEVYARLYWQVRQAGTPIPTNDLWIASLAVQHQLVLFTRDEHFDKLPQVPRA